jgi:hypothetical protein
MTKRHQFRSSSCTRVFWCMRYWEIYWNVDTNWTNVRRNHSTVSNDTCLKGREITGSAASGRQENYWMVCEYVYITTPFLKQLS